MSEEQKAVQKGPYTVATGRRKNAVARVFMKEGAGTINVNRRTLEDYFPRESHRLIINQPIKKAGLESKLWIRATVRGGGVSGQAQALRHGITRAIVKNDTGLRTILKQEGFLTRDPRAKERKKYGRKRARKKFQYSKR
jgi:small subunit ribosomal protein S9